MTGIKTLVFAAALVISSVQADTIKITAQEDDTFEPDTVKAGNGDILEFHFQPQNHSVVMGEYANACSPAQLGKGFFSGYMDTDSGEASKVFRVTVSDSKTAVFYSSQGDECSKGMVGIINPSANETLDGYRDRAAKLARSVAPANKAFGGDLVDNNDKGKDSKDGKDDKKSSAALTAASTWAVVAGAAVMGAAHFVM